MVAVETEAADPDLVDGREINDRERVDNRSATAASKRGIREERSGGREWFQGGVNSGDWN